MPAAGYCVQTIEKENTAKTSQGSVYADLMGHFKYVNKGDAVETKGGRQLCRKIGER